LSPCTSYYYSLLFCSITCLFLFFFTATSTTEIYTLSLHDALPILWVGQQHYGGPWLDLLIILTAVQTVFIRTDAYEHRLHGRERSEEHTSELQSRFDLVCRLLLEKKKKKKKKKKN